jgi:hypothetical protein
LNPDFNIVRVQAIMETIQRMAPDGSPLTLLAQQGAEAANLVIAEKSTGVSRREPSGGHNDQARRARSEVASSFSPNRRLAGNDVRRRITQNHNVREYGRDRDDIRNIIEDRRRFRDRTSYVFYTCSTTYKKQGALDRRSILQQKISFFTRVAPRTKSKALPIGGPSFSKK